MKNIATFLLEALNAFQNDGSLIAYKGWGKNDVYEFLFEVTKEKDINRAIAALEDLLSEPVAGTVPEHLKEMVAKLEEEEDQLEGAGEQVKEDIVAQSLKEFIEKRRKGETKEAPPTERVIYQQQVSAQEEALAAPTVQEEFIEKTSPPKDEEKIITIDELEKVGGTTKKTPTQEGVPTEEAGGELSRFPLTTTVKEKTEDIPGVSEGILYLVPTKPLIVSEIKESTEKLVAAARANPEEFSEWLRGEIEKKTGIDEDSAELTARDVTLRFLNEESRTDLRWVMTSVASPDNKVLEELVPKKEDRESLVAAAADLGLLVEAQEEQQIGILSTVFDKDTINFLYDNGGPVQYTLSTSPPKGSVPGTLSFGLKDFSEWYFQSWKPLNFQEKGEASAPSSGTAVFDTKASEVITPLQNNVLVRLGAGLDWSGPAKAATDLISSVFSTGSYKPAHETYTGFQFQSRIYTYLLRTQAAKYISPQYIRFLELIGGTTIQNTGIPALVNPYRLIGNGKVLMSGIGKFSTVGKSAIQQLVSKGVAKAAGKAAAGVAAKAATTGVLSSLGAALGSAAPVVGTIIGFIAGALIGKFLEKLGSALKDLVKKGKDNILNFLAIGLIALGFLQGGTTGALFILGGLLSGVGILAGKVGGMGGLAQGAGSFTGTLTTALSSVVLPSIAMPAGIAIISFVVITAFVTLVIRSGAFVFPPATSISGGVPSGSLCLPSSGTVTQLAYCESGNYSHCPRLNGYDIAAPYGTPIYAVQDGTAYSYADDPSPSNTDRGYGNHVIIRSSDGTLSTLYGHMYLNTVIPPGSSKGVRKGEIIGYMDNTGRSDGSHVHFELLLPRQHIKTLFGDVTVGQTVSNCAGK